MEKKGKMGLLPLVQKNKLYIIDYKNTSFEVFLYFCRGMNKQVFKILAKVNKAIFPSLAKRKVDMSKAKKWQMAIIGWRYYITKNSLD